MKNNKNQVPSLILRLTAPIALVVLAMFLALFFSSYNIAERIYNYQIEQTLTGKVQLTHDVLYDGWKRTTGTTLRTEDILREYVSDVLKGSIDFLAFPKGSGLLLVDTPTENILRSFPETISEKPKREELRMMLKKQNTGIQTLNLPNGGIMVSQYFPEIHIHIIGFNIANFAENPQQKALQNAVIGIFLATSVVLFSMMFYMLRRHVLSPLRKIQMAISDILMHDKFSRRVEKEGASELQQLGDQFNTLITHVDDRDRALQHHNKNLEKLVKERKQKLEETQKQLVLQERLAAIGEFASSVAHELRNPLASIKMGVEKIGENHLNETDCRRLQLVNKEVVRLDSMLKGILAFAAPRPTTLTDIDLKSYITDNSPLFEALAKEESIFIQVEPPKRKTIVKADVDKLLQVLINIVKNGAEAAKLSSAVTLSCKSTKQGAEIHIHNEGEPIPQETLSRLFEPFYTTKKSGTGLGLPTSMRLMQEMGGDIIVQSSKQNGTTFTLLLSK